MLSEEIRARVEALARRAGLAGAPPAAIVAVCALVVVAVLWAGVRWWPRSTGGEGSVAAATESSSTVAPGVAASAAESSPSAGARLLVHVVGSVRHPGVYELPASARVIDALEAAGGALPDAACEYVNLARPLADGEQVSVPSEDDPPPAAPPAATAGGAAGVGAAPGPIDLNTADAAALDTLPGVGPATAAKIVADREANGPFASVEDLGRVAGIGPKKLEQLEGLVCVR